MKNLLYGILHKMGLCGGTLLYTKDEIKQEFYLQCINCPYRTEGVKLNATGNDKSRTHKVV